MEEFRGDQEKMNGATPVSIALKEEDEERNQQFEYLESLERMLPLYKFSPTDADLIVLFLNVKINGEAALPLHKIYNTNIYDYSPDDLTSLHRSWGEGDWYFFTPRFRKYLHGTRPKREAGGGYWKATGGDKTIYDKENNVVGFKKVLVFYTGKSKESKVSQGNNTKWMMNEYTVKERKPVVDDENPWLLDKCVLCKIYEKGGWIENALHGQKKVSCRRKVETCIEKKYSKRIARNEVNQDLPGNHIFMQKPNGHEMYQIAHFDQGQLDETLLFHDFDLY